MQIKIDKMNSNDLNLISYNLETEFDNFWNLNILKEELKNENSIYFVAKDTSGKIIGFAGILIILDEANITNIVTKKTCRKHGIGSLLLQQLIDVSVEKKLSSITLEVNENNASAIKLYEKFNFRKMGLRKKYYKNKENAIIMTLELNR